MAYKGYYKPHDITKYKGNPTNIIYRSLWERRFMLYCDTNTNIIAWSSEEINIPYRSPIDQRIHRYYPDFWVKVQNTGNKIQQYLIEIKPKKQTKPPQINKKMTKRYLQEVKTWSINEAKWNAAIDFCNKRNWIFKILTENELLKK